MIRLLITAVALVTTVSPATAGASHSCLGCTPIAKVVGLGDTFARIVYNELAGHAADLVLVLGQIWFILFAFKLILQPREVSELWPKVLGQCTLITVLTSALHAGGGGWFFDWVFDLFQLQAIEMGNFIVDVAKEAGGLPSGASTSGTTFTVGSTTWSSSMAGGTWEAVSFSDAGTATTVGTAYVTMWMHVEDTIYLLLDTFLARLGAAGWIDFLPTLIIWVIVILPFLFILVIFGAFLIQASFYFVVVACISPLLLLGLLFEKTRGFFFAGMRLCLSGALTIIFAAAALGLTATIVADGITEFVQTVQENDQFYTDVRYLQLIITGWLSVAMHLIAPRLASNVSGAQDSATSAAAAVGLSQWVTAKSVFYGYRGARKPVVWAGAALSWAAGSAREGAGQKLQERFSRARRDEEA